MDSYDFFPLSLPSFSTFPFSHTTIHSFVHGATRNERRTRSQSPISPSSHASVPRPAHLSLGTCILLPLVALMHSNERREPNEQLFPDSFAFRLPSINHYISSSARFRNVMAFPDAPALSSFCTPSRTASPFRAHTRSPSPFCSSLAFSLSH